MRRDITVVAEPRTGRGKNESRRLRAAGSAPAVIYGCEGESVAVAVNPKELVRILGSKAGHNTIFNVAVTGGETVPAMIVDWQTDPIKSTLLHADLKRIDLSQRLSTKVPVHTTGEPKGVKLQGGLLEMITREIEIECLPDEIPEGFTLDVSELMMGQSVRASDVTLAASMTLVSQPEAVIAHVVALRAEEVAAPAEGEAAAAPAAAAEPEVIKKGKKEEEGAEKDKEKKK
jgi:large subunit ribosomal protein L25